MDNASGTKKRKTSSGSAGAKQGPDATTAKVWESLVTFRGHSAAVHVRISEFLDVLSQVRDGMGPDKDIEYSAMLEKFDAINKLAGQMCAELRDSSIDSYVIHPGRGAAQLQAGLIPDLLRTMREGEIERDVETLREAYPHPKDAASIERRITTHNNIVENVLVLIEEKQDELTLEPIKEEEKREAPAAANAILAALTSGAGL